MRAKDDLPMCEDPWPDPGALRPEVLVLFPDEVPEALGAVLPAGTDVVAQRLDALHPEWFAPESGLDLRMTAGERLAAEAARCGLLLACETMEPSPAWCAAMTESLLGCLAHGAVAVVLPATRTALGPQAIDALVPLLSTPRGWQGLFLQVRVVRGPGESLIRTEGMRYFGLPDLQCRTAVEQEADSRRMVEAGIVHLMRGGRDALPPGCIAEATGPDGRWLGRFEVRADSDGEDEGKQEGGAPGVLQVVPVLPQPGSARADRVAAADPGPPAPDRLLAGQRVRDLDLRGAAMAGVDLGAVRGERLDLSHAELREANLREARLSDCRLDAAQLEGSDWTGASLRLCSLDGARAARACFDGARLEDSSVAGADLHQASLAGAKLSQTSFERSVLRAAVLDGASGASVVFRGADLSGASLVGAQLDEADFRGADLRGASLASGAFGHADFRGALLERTVFDGADLHQAQFDQEAAQAESGPDAGSEDSPTPEEDLLGVLESFAQALAGRFSDAGARPSELLAELLAQTDAALEAVPPEQAEPLHHLLERLRGMESQADSAESLVTGMCAMLEEARPLLSESVSAADWQEIVSRLVESGGRKPDRRRRSGGGTDRTGGKS